LLHFFKMNIKRLLTVAGIVAGCYLFFATAFVVVALAVDGRRVEDLQFPPASGEVGNGENADNPLPAHFLSPPTYVENDEATLFRPAARTNFVLLGLDLGRRADAVMVGTFYRDSGEVRLMSVPRDLYIVLTAARHGQIRDLGLNVPGQLKLTNLNAYGGSVWGPQLILQEMSDLFGVTFHYVVEVRLPAFRRIVDTIGGVYFTVPRRLFYEDPCQNLVIDVPGGHRRLNGVQAEGVVRYRGFANADLGRNRMQMDFMQALISQALTRENIMSNLVDYARIVIEDVNTNMTIPGMFRYLPYITATSADKITTFTMPGTDAYRRGVGSVFLPCLDTLHEVAWEVFFANIEPESEPEPEPEPDEEL